MAKVGFTAGKVAGFKCPADKQQAFMWEVTKGLGLRATPKGDPSYIFQSEYQGKSLRLTIGSPKVWSIPQAQEKARELQRQIDEGRDPREVKAASTAADVAQRNAAKHDGMTFNDVWTDYLEDRKPHWGVRHHADQQVMTRAGGLPTKRGKKKGELSVPGLLFPFAAMRLREISPEVVEAWALKEAKTRKTSGRLAWRCLKAFFTWCTEHKEYKHLVPVNPAKTKKSREAFGKPAAKTDVLQRGQLATWFAAMRKIENPVISAYLQVVLLTGARPGEVMALKWKDVNVKWKGINIRETVEDEDGREIPATPYVLHLLSGLPRRNQWVFSSTRGRTGHITEPTDPHTRACKVAALDGLTLHGLRRSFKSLTEWLEIPAGVVAQIMGHKPSATAEKHYTVRPLEMLAIHHEKIEAWMLEQAKIVFDAKAEPGTLRVVAA
jgi:integrase